MCTLQFNPMPHRSANQLSLCSVTTCANIECAVLALQANSVIVVCHECLVHTMHEETVIEIRKCLVVLFYSSLNRAPLCLCVSILVLVDDIFELINILLL